jgi:hypothetical protein
MLTPEQFSNEMKSIFKNLDTEGAHVEADRLMCELLRELGYSQGVQVFKEAEKWYA